VLLPETGGAELSLVLLACRAPGTQTELVAWIDNHLREPSHTWRRRSPRSYLLPFPVNLPGMDQAAAAVAAKYCFMPVEWQGDVIQDFMVWLLRSATRDTLARSALRGAARGVVPTVEAGIAWKLRMEILSRAHRAYAKEERRRACEQVELAAYEWEEAFQANAV
jgi:hypothetical protein